MHNRQTGFTLLEAVVTLAVFGGLLALGVPAMGEMVQSMRLQAVAGDVFQQLLLARSEAIKRNARVVLCKSADGDACAQEGSWQQGGILFHDRNNSGTREPAEPLLQRLPALPADFRLLANGPIGRYVSYGPTGGTRIAGSGSFQAGTFTVCRASPGSTDARQIIINGGGRPRVQKVRVDNCF